MNNIWFFLIKNSDSLKKYNLKTNLNLKRINNNDSTIIFLEKTRTITDSFFKIYSQIKLRPYKSYLNSTIYERSLDFYKNNLSKKSYSLIYLDFSKKQLYTTKKNLLKKTIYTISNGAFLKKIKTDSRLSKNQFFLKPDFLELFFKKLLNLKKKKSDLSIKGHSSDLYNFLQRLERFKILQLFNNIILNFSGNYNLNKKKRVRSIKKRFKKGFLKYENKIIRNFLKIY